MTQSVPTPIPRKSRVGLAIAVVIGAVILFCVGLLALAALVGDGEPAAVATTPAASPAAAPILASNSPTPAPASGLNTPVRDGMFEFVVTKVQCGVARVGSPDFGERAQGQFCLVTMKITNIGDEARNYYSGNQYAYNAVGQRYDADTLAAIYLPDDNGSLDAINPGINVTAMIVFDIPKAAKLTALELHDSAFSGGVRVTL